MPDLSVNVQSEQPLIESRDVGGVAGYAIGVLHLAVPFVFVPGNIQNATTLPFPIAYECVEGVGLAELIEGAPNVQTSLIAAACRLERRGVRAIVGACGSFANFQSALAAAVSVPVFASVLTQIPWLLASLPMKQRLLVVFADSISFTARMRSQCGILDTSRLVITDCLRLAPFRALVEQPYRISHSALRTAVAEHVAGIVRTHSDIGMILLQCSELPPYAADIQALTRTMVVDVVTLAKWVFSTVIREPYAGYL